MVNWELHDLSFLTLLDDIVHERDVSIGSAYDDAFWSAFASKLTRQQQTSEPRVVFTSNEVRRRGEHFKRVFDPHRIGTNTPPSRHKELLDSIFREKRVPKFSNYTPPTQDNWKEELGHVLSCLAMYRHGMDWEWVEIASQRLQRDKTCCIAFCGLPPDKQVDMIEEMDTLSSFEESDQRTSKKSKKFK